MNSLYFQHPRCKEAHNWADSVAYEKSKIVEYFIHTPSSAVFYYDDHNRRVWLQEHVLLFKNKFYIAWHKKGIRIGFTNGTR